MQVNDEDAEIIAAAREGFMEEASDMLRQFEQALLTLENTPDDTEMLNAAFRAAHTIKGTAGLFGFTHVVSFTHGVESVMDDLRSGSLPLSADLFAVLLACRDQMEKLMDEVVSGQASDAVAERGRELTEALLRLRGQALPEAPGASDASPAAPPAELLPTSPSTCWHITLRFGPDALRNGLDPLAFIRYLRNLGDLQAVHTWTDPVPELAHLDPESCHLGFDIALATERGHDDIAAVFEFAEDDCDIHILAPDTERQVYLTLGDQLGLHDEGLQRWLQVLDQQGCAVHERHEHPADEAAELSAASIDPVPVAEDVLEPLPVERRTPVADRRVNDQGRRAGDAKFIRVRADKLDKLIDLIGELVIASSGAQLAAHQERSPLVTEATQRIHDLVQEARDGALGLRMVPIGETFSRFQRVVRDVSKNLGKDVDLQITGADTELDKSMVETIADPLMHLVRNSLDHGIESASERLEQGKSAKGQLALHAYHESGTIVIEVSDDGRGLNRERILTKAIERGLVSPEQTLSDAEVHQLICHPGFSTAEQVTDISGRGVGMDVVKRNIEALRGQMLLASEAGRGTTTQIRLPLTLAIIDGFLCEVGDVHYVVPLEMVVECIETPSEYRRAPEASTGYFDLRGETLPYLDLARHFGVKPQANSRRSLLLVRAGIGTIGLIVDKLAGEHQTVIKPLGAMFSQVRGLAGSTILGSGDVALILDVPALVNQCVHQSHLVRSHADGTHHRH
ncbi:chemotaxis protein CheA [Aquabacterium sp. A3]|uniref:chemotaxis protein CheA n=1 Tax=Aquabacterium sp. A3 TaxID=3132829 RepID=UPI0031198CAF